MKRIKFLILASSLVVAFSSGCAAKALEKEYNVVFMNEGKIVDSGTVTQFKNFQTPTIDKSYIPTDFRFLGWTTYEEDELDYTSATNFKTQYIGGGRMVHFSEVDKVAKSSTVVYKALMLHKDDIPKEYHYAVLAWYNKEGTSGISEAKMDTFTSMINAHFASIGVSEEDIASVVVRGYSGNVGPTTGQILYDNDVDIMLGWGSLSNISSTGSIPAESVLESVEFPITYNGAVKTRYIHRLGDSEGAIKLMEYLKSQETKDFFN